MGMKILSYLLVMSALISGIDFITQNTDLNACPRCRRALPKGPRKRPHPGFPKKENHNISVSNMNGNTSNDTKEKLNERK
jgi:hypothetical protein